MTSAGPPRLLMLLAFASGLPVALTPRPVEAANGDSARVPPQFHGHGCIALVDRSAPLHTFEYTLPFEGGTRTSDEPPSSRTLEFLALCRSPEPLEMLPNWIDDGDVDEALEVGLLQERPEDANVLSRAPAWMACGQTIESRRPTTCDAAESAVVWDTTNVPRGAYRIAGYTFEPNANLWTLRDGVVVVADDPDHPPPAFAWSWPISSATVSIEEPIALQGCLVGPPDLRLELAWAALDALEETGDDAWQLIESFAPQSDRVEVEFRAPPEALYGALVFRATLWSPGEDPWITYTEEPLVVVPGCAAVSGGDRPAPSDGCGLVPDAPVPEPAIPPQCEMKPVDTDSEEEPSDPAAPSDSAGCGIAPLEGGWMGTWWVLLVVHPLRRETLDSSPGPRRRRSNPSDCSVA